MADFGNAKTNNFMLSEATIMLGPQADLYKLTPSANGIGLAKSLSIVEETGYVELTQGVQNDIVFSTKNKSTVRATFEVYEYTSKNIAYSLGLNGSLFTATTVATTLASATSGTISTPDVSISVDSATGLSVGDWIIVRGEGDEVYADKIATISTNDITLVKGIPAIVAAGGVVKKAEIVPLGSRADQPFLALAAVGSLADGTRMRVMLPKVRITKGFTFNFGSTNFGNMPFEATVYRPVETDPNYADFTTSSGALIREA